MKTEENTSKADFIRYVEMLGLADDRSMLQVLTGIHRSILHKYLAEDTESKVTNVPQSAVSLVRLLALVKQRSSELYLEWCTLQQVSPETFDKAIDEPDTYERILSLGVLKYGRDKIR